MKPFAAIFGANAALLTAWTLVDPMKWNREMDGPYDSYGMCEAVGNAWKYFHAGICLVNFAALVGAVVQAYKARNLADEFS